eukprot:COSAG02_NODE_1567_length_11900_cov_6.050250_8_plen_44_part_00
MVTENRHEHPEQLAQLRVCVREERDLQSVQVHPRRIESNQPSP